MRAILILPCKPRERETPIFISVARITALPREAAGEGVFRKL
jgi:hypothetical protein